MLILYITQLKMSNNRRLKMNKYKTHTCNEISLEDVGKKVRIAGFVET